MVKMKKQGCPMDSLESVRAWRAARQNIAARKPEPAGLPGFNARPSYPKPEAPPSPPAVRAGDLRKEAPVLEEDFQAARTRREIAEASLSELREAEARGELIRVDAIRSALAGMIAATRDSLLQIPARVAPVLAVETDAGRVHDMIQSELHQALAQLVASPDRITRIEADR